MKRLVADNFPLGKSHYPMLFDGSIGSCYNGRNWTTFQNVGQTLKKLPGILFLNAYVNSPLNVPKLTESGSKVNLATPFLALGVVSQPHSN